MKSCPLTTPLVLLALVSDCASSAPPELVHARSAYQEASHGPAAQRDPADLQTARETLAVAERAFDKDGDAQDTRDIAYAAQRRAELADTKARAAVAMDQNRQAVAEMQAVRDTQARMTAAQLNQARQQLQAQGQQLQEAERRAAQASAELARVASVKNEVRGMVITLPGAVLFATGQSTLLPPARAKLAEVAAVLGQQDKTAKIRIEGYTDSTGTLAVNERLSEERAESVKSFLASHQISSDRIEAVGMGPANPVADNSSPEGRADNRRVEIIVQHPGPGRTDQQMNNGSGSTNQQTQKSPTP